MSGLFRIKNPFGKPNLDGNTASHTGRNRRGGFQNLSNWSQNQWENLSGKTTRENNKFAQAEAEKARRESIVKEFGAREQADSMAFGAAMSKGGSNNAPGIIGNNDAPGTIGANISSAGTF
jgi:hypothetical protein